MITRRQCLMLAGLSVTPLLTGAGPSLPGAQPQSLRALTGAGIESARNVLRRLVGERANEFQLESLPQQDPADVYEISAARGTVLLRGNSAIALTRGAYEYLRTHCNGMVTWSGENLSLPASFPAAPVKRVQAAFRLRQYFNVCTFGYTTVWWDWKRWEREIDWMALHGINMPLALNGQEAIWLRVWKLFGISRDELDDYFTGPAFLPWHRMGNVNRHGGPLSDHWMDEQRLLQKKILNRMRELGMRPIVPAFSGFIPAALRREYPHANVVTNSNWADFPAEYQTTALAPNAPLFIEIGKRFIEEYEGEFGASDYYLADSFNELNVPVSKQHRYDELAAYGASVFRSINEANPQATWVMQGWLFNYNKSFWDRPSVRALLRDVPDDRMIVLDLANELFRGWKEHDEFYGKRWIYSVINNFGGNNPLHGDLKFCAHDPSLTLSQARSGELVGLGMAPEGIENNEVIYELLTDAAWSRAPVDLSKWLLRYQSSRYGRSSPQTERAWQLLLREVYGNSATGCRHAFQKRPSLQPQSDVPDTGSLRSIVELFRGAPAETRRSTLFVNDLIEVTAHFAGTRIDGRLRNACAAHSMGNSARRDACARAAVAMLHQLDGLLHWRGDMRLEKWLGTARSHGRDDAEKNLLERNARLQVTVWGGPDLHDYASKLWSGLVRDFYARRWELFFVLLRRDAPDSDIQKEMVDMEQTWTEQRTLSAPATALTLDQTISRLLKVIDESCCETIVA
jgi:alpha-N-acetylglucosaminidase